MRTPHWVITAFIQPITITKTEGLFCIYTKAPLYILAVKKKKGKKKDLKCMQYFKSLWYYL